VTVAEPEATALSVVIVNWNARELLARCLTSIEAHLPEVPYEVWVVDNASQDGSAAMVREQFPGVRLLENEENVGFAAANNLAIRESRAYPEPGRRSRYTLLLNPDTEVRPRALQALVAFMEAHPQAGAVGARLLNPDGSLQPSCHPMLTPGREFWRLMFLERIWPRASYPMHRWDTGTPRQVEVIKGACLTLRGKALDQVGLLDAGYFMYTEEVDLCYRLAQAGWELWWVPEAEVVHHEAASTRQAAEAMYVELYRSKVRFYRKYGGEAGAGRFKRLVRLAYGLRLAVAALGSPFSPALAQRARTCRRLLAELPGM
jgi:N-acetylglucosaminyl-diphospho-decaprenol L-rhamnosyltransferase